MGLFFFYFILLHNSFLLLLVLSLNDLYIVKDIFMYCCFCCRHKKEEKNHNNSFIHKRWLIVILFNLIFAMLCYLILVNFTFCCFIQFGCFFLPEFYMPHIFIQSYCWTHRNICRKYKIIDQKDHHLFKSVAIQWSYISVLILDKSNCFLAFIFCILILFLHFSHCIFLKPYMVIVTRSWFMISPCLEFKFFSFI